MRTRTHVARRVFSPVATLMAALAAAITVNLMMARPAHAATPAAINDCTAANALLKYLNFVVYSLANLGKAGGWIMLLVGLMIGFGGAIASRGSKGWSIAAASIGLIIVVFSLVPILGTTPFACTPKVTIG